MRQSKADFLQCHYVLNQNFLTQLNRPLMKADKEFRHDVLTPITPHRRHPFYEFTIFESDRYKRADGSPCIFLAGWPKNKLELEVIAELRPPKDADAIYSFTYDRRLMHIIPTHIYPEPIGDFLIIKNERYPKH